MTSSADHTLLSTLMDALRARHRITLVLAPDLGRYCGRTELVHGVVFLSDRNSDGEQLATLTHELIHLACPDCGEDDVERQAAERLVPLPDALAAQATGGWAEAADRLGVDAQLIRARVRDVHQQAGEAG